MLKIFLDTNIFLHFRFVGEIPAKKIYDGPFEFVIPHKVISELNEKKDGNDQKLKSRARKALNFIETLEDGPVTLDSGIVISWYQQNPDIDWAERGLSRDVNDDVIIATILTYKGGNQNIEVGLLTDDTAMRMMARRYNIKKIIPNEDYALPDESDENKKELERLRAESLLEKNRKPKLSVVMIKDGSVIKPPSLTVPYANRQQIPRAHFDQLITEYTKDLTLFTIYPATPASTFNLDAAMGLTNRRKQEYNESVGRYKTEIKAFLDVLNRYWDTKALTIPIELRIMNEGAAPAGNVDIKFIIPFSVSLAEPPEPKVPTAPKRPGPGFDSPLLSIDQPALRFPAEHFIVDKGRPEVSQNKDGTSTVSQNFEEVKHHHSAAVGRFYLKFPSLETVRSFNVEYEITCREFKDKIIGKVDFIVNSE